MNVVDPYRILYLRDLPKPAKHLTFDASGSHITASCTDGVIYVYSLSTEEPELLRKIEGVVAALEPESEASSRAVWHPDGRAFIAPTPTRDLQLVSAEGEKQKIFSNGHLGDVTAVAWSPNGALLLTAGKDKKMVVWETKTQKALARFWRHLLRSRTLANTSKI